MIVIVLMLHLDVNPRWTRYPYGIKIKSKWSQDELDVPPDEQRVTQDELDVPWNLEQALMVLRYLKSAL